MNQSFKKLLSLLIVFTLFSGVFGQTVFGEQKNVSAVQEVKANYDYDNFEESRIASVYDKEALNALKCFSQIVTSSELKVCISDIEAELTENIDYDGVDISSLESATVNQLILDYENAIENEYLYGMFLKGTELMDIKHKLVILLKAYKRSNHLTESEEIIICDILNNFHLSNKIVCENGIILLTYITENTDDKGARKNSEAKLKGAIKHYDKVKNFIEKTLDIPATKSYVNSYSEILKGLKNTGFILDEECFNSKVDTDGDTITDGYELLLRTNPFSKDTDGDGLDDNIELGTSKLCSPLKFDTDGNGLSDLYEDIDKDGLTNKQELMRSTSLLEEDSDNDGLKDGFEVYNSKTLPDKYDTDEDRLSDGDEYTLGTDPNNSDSDGDGINDNEEKFIQTLKVNIVDEEKSEVTAVSVTLNGTGNVQTNTTIESVYNIDSLSSDVVGLIGVPVEIESESQFDEATITFYYDDSLLTDTNEEDLAIMWYDEENDFYQIFDVDSVVDTVNNTISYTTTHFSTYLVVDRQKWYDVWSNIITPRRNPGHSAIPTEYFDISYVIDSSGSMLGSSISTAKEAINYFIDAMFTNDRASIVSFNSTATVKSSFSSDKVALQSTIKSLNASGGTSVNAGLIKSIELFESSNSSNSKMILLLCDGDVNYTEQTIERAKNNNIKIYPVLIGSTSGMSKLQRIADETGGTLYYAKTAEEIRKAIFGVQDKTVGSIDKTDTDGDGLYDIYETAGMIISNGRCIYSDPLLRDTDGDGLTDDYEMGNLEKFEDQLPIMQRLMIFKGFDKEIYVEYFSFNSNPILKDTDGDSYDDNIDAYPLRDIEEKHYIFYEKGGDDFLIDEALSRKRIIIDNDVEAEVVGVNTVADFTSEWDNMGLDSKGKVEYAISDVYTVFHGSPVSIRIGNNERLLNADVSNLADKRIGTLHLSSCNNGNVDWLNVETIGGIDFEQNMAISFLKELNGIEEVKAWDGYATYFNIGDFAIEYSSSYTGFWEMIFDNSSFDKWSKAKNDYVREVSGLITYSRDSSGQIVLSPNKKYFYAYSPLVLGRFLVSEEITEVIK